MTKSLFINEKDKYLRLSINSRDPDYKNIHHEIKEIFPNCIISKIKSQKLGSPKIIGIELFIYPPQESFNLICSIGKTILNQKYDIKTKYF